MLGILKSLLLHLIIFVVNFCRYQFRWTCACVHFKLKYKILVPDISRIEKSEIFFHFLFRMTDRNLKSFNRLLMHLLIIFVNVDFSIDFRIKNRVNFLK